MTLDFYRGLKTTIQQQQTQLFLYLSYLLLAETGHRYYFYSSGGIITSSIKESSVFLVKPFFFDSGLTGETLLSMEFLLPHQVVWVHRHLFMPCFQRETIFMTSCLLTWRMKSFQMGSTLKGKNLLRLEQILFYKS